MKRRAHRPAVVITFTGLAAFAAAAFAIFGACESYRLTDPNLPNDGVSMRRPGNLMNVGVRSLDPETRAIGLDLSPLIDGNTDVLSIPYYAADADASNPTTFAMGGEVLTFYELHGIEVARDTNKLITDQKRLLNRTAKLIATGGPFLYPFDQYTLTFTMMISTHDGSNYDSSVVPNGGERGYAGVVAFDTIPGFKTKWSGTPAQGNDRKDVYIVKIYRPIFFKVLYVCFFALILVATIVAVGVATDRRGLLPVAAGVIGTTWAVRNIVLAGNSFKTATLVDVTAFFIVLMAAVFIVLRVYRLPARTSG